MVLSTALLRANNSFNLLRLGAASAVIISHAFVIAYGATAPQPLENHLFFSLGMQAVNVFFVLSGVLVAASADRATSVIDFMSARVLRIYPGLLFCLAALGCIDIQVSDVARVGFRR